MGHPPWGNVDWLQADLARLGRLDVLFFGFVVFLLTWVLWCRRSYQDAFFLWGMAPLAWALPVHLDERTMLLGRWSIDRISLFVHWAKQRFVSNRLWFLWQMHTHIQNNKLISGSWTESIEWGGLYQLEPFRLRRQLESWELLLRGSFECSLAGLDGLASWKGWDFCSCLGWLVGVQLL